MLFKKAYKVQDIERLAEKGVDVIIWVDESPEIYKSKESKKENRQIPNYQALYHYEIFIPSKELAKRIKKIFRWTSIGKPLGIVDHFDRLRYRIWEKTRRKLHLGGPFGMAKIYGNLHCIAAIAEWGEVERKLVNLSTSAEYL